MKKLLFIRYRKPERIDAGGEQATNSNYRVLCSLLGEENVTTIYVHESPSKWKLIVNAFGIFYNFVKGYYYGLSPRRVNDMVRKAKDFDYVFIDRSIFGVIAGALKQDGYKGKIITFFHNVESVYFRAKIGKNKPWCSLVEHCAFYNDNQACRHSDTIIVLNERDRGEIARLHGRRADLIAPIVFKDTYQLEKYPDEPCDTVPTCLFLGTYFPMNVHGILWFIREVMPHVSIRLQIVGKGMSAIESQIENKEHIEVYSDVPDLRPYIEKADFMLLPIFEGSGMKVKTCEALMYGKNIIGTTEAFEGYALDYEKVGALCNTRDEFIAALQDATTHPRARFNRYAREIFLNNYSEQVKVERYKEVLF